MAVPILLLVTALALFNLDVLQIIYLNNVQTTTLQVSENTLKIDGIINSKTPQQIRKVFAEHPEVDTIEFIEVLGSINDEANLEIANWLIPKDLTTKISSTGLIASGGTDLFLVGDKRIVEEDAKIGVHSWHGGDKSATDFPKDHENHKPYIAYYVNTGMTQQQAEDFYFFTINAAPSDDIYMMTPDEINKYGIATKFIEKEKIPNENIAYFQGNINADTVIIYAQGRRGKLERSTVDLLHTELKIKTLVVLPYQTQTLEPARFNTKVISFEQAKKKTAETTEKLNEVIKYFKNQNKRVFVVGMSYGAFVVLDSIETAKVRADRYYAVSGRVDMPDAVWNSLSQGQSMEFEDGETPVIDPAEENRTDTNKLVSTQNFMKLTAGQSYKRFSKLLNNNDLSNLVYIYNTEDRKVGSLNKEEIAFLETKNATIVEIEDEEHAGEETLYELFEEINDFVSK